MKKALIIILFILVGVAVWFRWLDDIDPKTAKVEIQKQASLVMEDAKSFSFKEAFGKVSDTLDRFFSPPDEKIDPNEAVFLFTSQAPSANEDNMVEQFNDLTDARPETPVPPVDIITVEETGGYPAPEPVIVVETSSEDLTQEVGALIVESKEPVEEPAVVETGTMDEVLPEESGGSLFEFDMQTVEPLFTTNFTNLEASCDWMGIGGQIFGKDQQPIDGLVIVVEGAVDNNMVEALGFSGLAPQYGPGGYEIVLAKKSKPGIFWIQLFDVDANPVSQAYLFQTPGTCEQNLAIINFTLSNDSQGKFIPIIEP